LAILDKACLRLVQHDFFFFHLSRFSPVADPRQHTIEIKVEISAVASVGQPRQNGGVGMLKAL
jgi:hypothetical protein